MPTYAVSHVVLATREAGAVATSAEVKKSNKYKELAWTHHVAPLAIETSGVFGPGTQEFVDTRYHGNGIYIMNRLVLLYTS